MKAPEIVSTAQRLIDNISAARSLAKKLRCEEVGEVVETFVVDVIDEWRKEGRQVGWILHPLGETYTNYGLGLSESGEPVAFEKLGEVINERGEGRYYKGVVPRVGDVVMVVRNLKSFRKGIQLFRAEE